VPGELATGLSIGKNYHSGCHIDANMYYTLLTVAGPEDTDREDVMYYFCFPMYTKSEYH